MKAEASVPSNQRFLMIVGRLGKSLIQELDETSLPRFIERQKNNGFQFPDADEATIDRYFNRDRTEDDAYFTLYACADL